MRWGFRGVQGLIAGVGVVHYEILEATANGERFRQYLHGLQDALIVRQIDDPIIVMDNVGFHHMEMVL